MAFEVTQTKHRAPMPSPGEESVIHGETRPRRQGFVQRQVAKIKRFRRERAERKKREAAAERKKTMEKEKARKKKEVTRKKTETAIQRRRRRQQQEMKDLGI